MNTRDRNRTDGMLATATSRRQAVKLMGGGLVGGLAMATGIKGVAAKKPSVGLPFDRDANVLVDGTEGLAEYLVITQFSHDGENLFASGNYYNTVDDVEGTFTTLVENISVDEPILDSGLEGTKLASVLTEQMSDVSLAQNNGGGECQILYLELAPLEIDLLGLVITLPNALVLDIAAVPGAGNLLGNLLCAVAGLLDGNGPLSGLTGLLNNLLRSLGLVQ